MEKRRLELQTMFESILGTRNVYYQPPESVKLKYPAIIYSLKQVNIDRADNRAYKIDPCFEGVLIDKDPDSKYLRMILDNEYCSFDRAYKSDNLNHFAFTIY